MAEDDAEKTEEPTDRKLSRARDEGQVAQSQEIKNFAILAAGLALIMTILPSIMARISDSLTVLVMMPEAYTIDRTDMLMLTSRIMVEMAGIIWPFFLAVTIVAIAANLFQTGLMWTPKKLQPKLTNISPISGLKRQFSSRSVIELLKGILKIGMVVLVAAIFVVPLLADIELIAGFDILSILDRLTSLVLALLGAAVVVMAVIALIDFLYQRYSHLKKMRMSKTEVKDEHKQQEGDPQVKAKIRQLRAQRTRERMMAAVPQADVVITNPTHYAVALKYDMEEMAAPHLIAKGIDEVALRIREVAEENDVPIVENPPLAQALYATVELEQEIPQEHYKAVAEVIGYVMRMKGGGGMGQAQAPIGGMQ